MGVLEDKQSGLRFTVGLEQGVAWYEVSRSNDELIERSSLGIERTDDTFVSGLSFVGANPVKVVSDDYELVVGKQRKISAQGLEQTFHFKNQRGALLDVDVRLYPDGAAFRYAFPGETKQFRFVTHETTAFHLPTAGKVWVQPYSKVDTWAPGYESKYRNGDPIGTKSPGEEGWALPALFQLSQSWVLVTEAGLDSTYFGSHLEQKAEDGVYRLRPPEAGETYGVAPQQAAITFPWWSPWRLIIIGKDLGTVVQSNLVTTLSKPAVIKDVSWIKPGRASWSWWSDMASPSEYKKLLPFIDAASKLSWEYSTIDLGWDRLTDQELRSLIDYAAKRNVHLLTWYNSGGSHNKVPDAGPRDLMVDPSMREHEMARLEALGIKGIKVDFFQSDKQYVIGLYEDIMRAAAKHHLLTDFHGATLPRGWSRTYPNLMTMEAVSGAEQYWSDEYAEDAQTINAIYPFTRNVVGPMDYTPTIFADAKHLKKHKTTSSHELALAVVFESGIQHFVDAADDLMAQPEFVQKFLHDLPAVWDQTVLVSGEPGSLAVLARRNGKAWYVGGINGERTSKPTDVPLTFLSAGKYHAKIISDGPSPAEFKFEEKDIKSTDTLHIPLAARGGFSVQILAE